ncbi:putative ABC transport system permease protein [Pseudochrobactrum saccharolyticum]|uniref:Putative ABC transport system permease protein n=1 Tax=Pseudochrobactrum saccharolyticum TaxID=354352 RepID=A0A7W8EMA4_9HYPH|nr:ABC transporter permease [Pseudochrobactrum saccharolyticum]KAB0540683.1 ABC transporter permease [Pseudochrobactrum saccharolyticum]MBB5090255.1 putative ABC transport system permease protein [Pseudochrobactrum saccharolyticum]
MASQTATKPSFALALRFALREMRGGLTGFYIFLGCIALGVAAIGGVNSVARSIADGLAVEGQAILGGDVSFMLNQREVTEQERQFLNAQGTVSENITMRSMVRMTDGSDQALVEVKAVDSAYPLYGTLKLAPDLEASDRFALQDGAYGAAVPQLLLDRLGLKLGDQIMLGSAKFALRAIIESEPDMLGSGMALAPRFLTSDEALRASGLIQPGSLVNYIYKIALPDTAQAGAQDTRLAALEAAAEKNFPEAGWNIRNRNNAAPALSANIERFSQFLTLVGLTSLIIGGVGVANAVRSFLDGKRPVIATFKSLGASADFVVLIYLFQIVAIALIGIVIGLVLSLGLSAAAIYGLSSYLPVSGGLKLYPQALLLATAFGLITTLIFALLPLGRARTIPATALFRQKGFDQSGWPPLLYMLTAGLLLLILIGLVLFFVEDQRIAGVFIVGAVAAFIILRGVSYALRMLARKAPRFRSPALRLAVGNIHRPGALTPSVVLSLGLGLTLVVALALVDGNLRRQITQSLPAHAPNFFFVDIQNTEIDGFRDLLAKTASEGKVVSAAMLRGRIVALNGTDVDKVTVPPQGAWVLRGDRGITYAKNLPENSTMTQGEWWPADYSGEPLVSFAAKEAEELGLKIGDTVTVNVLGRNITAKIANFRQVQWETLAINFVMVFSPNTFAGAPHSWLATLTDANAAPEQEANVLRTVTQTFPAVTSVRVKDAIEVANDLISQLAVAIRWAASVGLLAAILVLAGALAAGNRARQHDAVVLKTLGATRLTLIRAFVYEYALLGLATAVFALGAGGLAAWFVVVKLMNLQMRMLPDVAFFTVLTALVLTVGFGLAGTWRVLGQKAGSVLREL